MTTCVCPEPRRFNVTGTCGLWKEQVSTTLEILQWMVKWFHLHNQHLLTTRTRTMLFIDFVSVTVGNSHIPGFHANKSMDAGPRPTFLTWICQCPFQTSSPNLFNHQQLAIPGSWILIISDTLTHTHMLHTTHLPPVQKKQQKIESKDQYSWKFR